MESNTLTGRKFSSYDFRFLVKCKYCGIRNGVEVCEECKKDNIGKQCFYCGIVLRINPSKYYQYDNKKKFSGAEFSICSVDIREFVNDKESNAKENEEVCNDCKKGFKIKKECASCKRLLTKCEGTIENKKLHYRAYGNYCKHCDDMSEVFYPSEVVDRREYQKEWYNKNYKPKNKKNGQNIKNTK